jgi:hypothetical protein
MDPGRREAAMGDVHVRTLSTQPEYANLSDAEATILANTKSIDRSDGTFFTCHDLSPLVGVVGIDPLLDILRESGMRWVADTLPVKGLPFDTDEMQDNINKLETAGKIPPVLAQKLREVGRWKISPYEELAGRGAVCVEADWADARAVLALEQLIGKVAARYTRLFNAINAREVVDEQQAIAHFGS